MGAALSVPTAGDSPHIDPAHEPEFYGPIPQSIWRRKDVPTRAKVVLGGLGFLCNGSRTWVRASIEAIAAESGLSVKVARAGLAELTELGIVAWEAIEERFIILFRFRGKDDIEDVPAPRLGPTPEAESEPKRKPSRNPNGNRVGTQTGTESEPKREPSRNPNGNRPSAPPRPPLWEPRARLN